MKKALFCAAALFASLVQGTASAQTDTAVINFNGDVTTYAGTDRLNPFLPGTILFDLEAGNFPFNGLEGDDYTAFNGQIIIPDYQGAGTYTSSADGLGIFLHSPVLNRIETVSLRTERGVTAPGVGRTDGMPSVNRDDIYAPDFTPNGSFSVTISATNEVSISYSVDFSNISNENALFLREDGQETGISALLRDEANGPNGDAPGVIDPVGPDAVQLTVFEFSGTTPATAAIFNNDGVDDAAVPYGGYFDLDTPIFGNLSNTITDLTRGALRIEIGNNNVSTDGRLVTDPLTPTELIGFDDLNGLDSGTGGQVYFFDLNGFDASGERETVFEASLTNVPDILLGDVNTDGAVNFLDLSPFIGLLTNGGFQFEADINQSGSVDFLDIAPFIQILTAS